MKISSNFHNGKIGIAKVPPKEKFLAARKSGIFEVSGKCFFDAGVINSEELMRGSDHINSVRFSLRALAVKELINGFVA